MEKIVLNHIYKIYDGGVTAVSDFNLTVQDQEFIVLVVLQVVENQQHYV